MGVRRFTLRSRLRRGAVLVVAGVTAAGLATPPAPPAAAATPAGFSDTVAISGLQWPTAAAFAPGGRVFVAEKSGVIKTFDSLADTSATVTADLQAKVHNYWDRGFLGMAVDPAFPTRPYVYALYSYERLPDGTDPHWDDGCPSPPGPTELGCVITAQLTKLTINAEGVATDEKPLITDWCQQYPSHSIGTVTFGPDGALYVGSGDGASFNFPDYGQRGNPCADPPGPAGTNLTAPTAKGGALRSQSPRRPNTEPVSLDGAILRVDPDTGDGLPGNPFYSSTDPAKRRIIAYGLRNPFRFGLRPGTKELWVGDVGWSTWEEINRVPDVTDSVAENFGWPCYEGQVNQPRYDDHNLDVCESLYGSGGQTAPHYTYRHGGDVVGGDGCTQSGSAISGIAFEDGKSNYPTPYRGALFFADSSRGCLWAMQRGENGVPDPAKIVTLQTEVQVPVQVLIGPGGDLFYVALGSGEVRRISYPGGANRPPTAVATATPSSGPSPLTVQFDGTHSTDPDVNDFLSYAWDLDGDGEYDDSTAARPSRTYTEREFIRGGLRVTDPFDASSTTRVEVAVDDPPHPDPTPQIDTPTGSVRWAVGDRIDFSGGATDAQDGQLPAPRLTWRLTLQHCVLPTSCHAHNLETFAGTASGSFRAPDHEYPSYLDLTLTATDSDGNTASKTIRIEPQTVTLSFASSPDKRLLTVGDVTEPAPFARPAIIGSTNYLSAVSPQDGYAFESWSDGGSRTREFAAPAADTTYRATYQPCTACSGPEPSAPRTVSAQGGLGRATVRWQPPEWPGQDGTTKYRITVSPGGRVVDNISPSATSQVIAGLADGTTYTFSVQAFSSAGPGPSVAKKLVGTKATISSKTTTWGYGATLTGKLYRSDSGTGLSGRPLTVQYRKKGTTAWQTLKTLTTGSGGTYSFWHKPSYNWEYRVLYLSGSTSYLGTASGIGRITVKQRVSAAFNDATVYRGTTVKLSGQVRPYHPGRIVYLQRYYSGRWNTVASKALSSTSRFSFSIKWNTAGTRSYRVYTKGHTDHASGLSPVRKLSVS